MSLHIQFHSVAEDKDASCFSILVPYDNTKEYTSFQKEVRHVITYVCRLYSDTFVMSEPVYFVLDEPRHTSSVYGTITSMDDDVADVYVVAQLTRPGCKEYEVTYASKEGLFRECQSILENEFGLASWSD